MSVNEIRQGGGVHDEQHWTQHGALGNAKEEGSFLGRDVIYSYKVFSV
jgi:hypothetical protein